MLGMITIHRQSLYIRAFLWIWRVDPDTLNICKLFWGTVLFPIAFVQYRPVFRHVPRIAVLYFVIAAISAAFGYIEFGEVFLGSSLVYIIFGSKFGVTSARDNEKAKNLDLITEHGSTFIDWLFDRAVFPIMDRVEDSREFGFLGVVTEYFRSVKERTCFRIRII